MKKMFFLIPLFLILFSCSSENKKEKKEISYIKVTYNLDNDFFTVYEPIYIIPDYIKKNDSIRVYKVGVNWNYCNDTSSAALKVRVDSVFYE